MVDVTINYVAVVAAAVASMIIGMAWYSPMLFGKTWMKLLGISDKQQKEGKKMMMKSMVGQFVASLVMAYVLSHFVDYSGSVGVVAGATAGFWTWLGFTATTQISGVFWEGRPFKLFLINTGASLLTFAVVGAIVATLV